MGNSNGMLWAILIALVAMLLVGGYSFVSLANTPIVASNTLSDEQINSIAEATIAKLPKPVEPTVPSTPTEAPIPDATLVSEIHKEVLKEKAKEDKALELVAEEMDSSDFKRLVMELLNAELPNSEWENSEIENWRDIVEIEVQEVDVDVSGDDAKVEYVLKITFLLDGDEDIEDAEKAKINVEFEVDGLDEDEEFEDAEVVDYGLGNLEFVKFY